MTRRLISLPVFALAILSAAPPASADIDAHVISAFHGQVVVTKDELPAGKNDKDTIKQIHAAQLKTLEGHPSGEVTAWDFHYTAFLTRKGASTLRFQFINDKKQLSADKALEGIDPKSAVLSGDISIDEDEGLTKGKTYTVELVNDKHEVVAKTTLTMK
jgi:hypothetical protein